MSQLPFQLMVPSYVIWWHKSGSTLAQVMACCLMAPSHYLNQCWLTISNLLSLGIHWVLSWEDRINIPILKIAFIKFSQISFVRHTYSITNLMSNLCWSMARSLIYLIKKQCLNRTYPMVTQIYISWQSSFNVFVTGKSVLWCFSLKYIEIIFRLQFTILLVGQVREGITAC